MIGTSRRTAAATARAGGPCGRGRSGSRPGRRSPPVDVVVAAEVGDTIGQRRIGEHRHARHIDQRAGVPEPGDRRTGGRSRHVPGRHHGGSVERGRAPGMSRLHSPDGRTRSPGRQGEREADRCPTTEFDGSPRSSRGRPAAARAPTTVTDSASSTAPPTDDRRRRRAVGDGDPPSPTTSARDRQRRAGADVRVHRTGRRAPQRAGDRAGTRAAARHRRHQRGRRRARRAGGSRARRRVGPDPIDGVVDQLVGQGANVLVGPVGSSSTAAPPADPRRAIAAGLLGVGDGDVADGRRPRRPRSSARRCATTTSPASSPTGDGPGRRVAGPGERDDRRPRRRLRQRADRRAVGRADRSRGRRRHDHLPGPAGHVPRGVGRGRRRRARPRRPRRLHRGAEPGRPARRRRVPGRTDRRSRRPARPPPRRADVPRRPDAGRRADGHRHDGRPGADGPPRRGPGGAGPDVLRRPDVRLRDHHGPGRDRHRLDRAGDDRPAAAGGHRRRADLLDVRPLRRAPRRRRGHRLRRDDRDTSSSTTPATSPRRASRRRW